MNSSEVILHLSLIEGVGPGTIETLVSNKPWDLDLQDLYRMRISDIARIFAVSYGKAELIVQGLADLSLFERERELIDRHRINWMTIYHDQYPHLLRNIHMPPSVVYWQGSLPTDAEVCLAIIGSRKMNHYGAAVLESFVPSLVEAGLVIVSGGALGADTAAHKITLAHAGKTVAVIGSGLLQPYPTSNQRLFADIIAAGGAVVSSFPLLMQPLAGNFPARNRIIAGLSRGCLVVQAARKSGTHITAGYALEQGRDLFAIPGPINDELCAGCHSLIQQGATLVMQPTDILEQLGMQHVLPVNNNIQSEQKSQMTLIGQEASSFKAEGPAAIILRNCTKPCSIDELAELTGLTIQQMFSQLFELELSGLVTQQANGLWERCR